MTPNCQEIFQIADTIEPLDKPAQLQQWERFNSMMRTLEQFYNRSIEAKSINLDNNFKYFNKELIDLFFNSEPNGLERAIVNRGIRAKDTLILTNLRLIIKCAKSFQRDAIDLGYLINEGVIGAIRSLVKFKPSSAHKAPKAVQLSLLQDVATDTEEPVRDYKVSSYMKTWVDCYVRAAVASHSEIISTPSKAKKQGKTFMFTAFDSDRLSPEIEHHMDSEIDFYALVQQKPDQLIILESSPIELALDQSIPIEDAIKLKQQVADELVKYIAA